MSIRKIKRRAAAALFLALLLLPALLPAQGHIRATAGSTIRVKANANLVLSDIRWEQEGTFVPELGTIRVIGSATPAQCAFVSSNGITLYQLDIKKPTNDFRLETDLNLSGKLNFLLGNLDLNGHDLSLGNTGLLIGEAETHRILDQTGGGAVYVTSTIIAPNQLNPGNIGLALSSGANWGVTTLIRRHDPANLGGGSSIRRSFEISPANNAGLNATLRFSYFDAELNGIAESGFELYRSTDNGLSWSLAGTAVHNPTANTVELSGINAFSLWTTAPLSSFPLTWLDFSARWSQQNQQKVALLEWRTANEQASDFFQVMRKEDDPASLWQIVGQRDAAGYSQGVLAYSFVDQQVPDPNGSYQYRIKQIDLDGQFTYSPTVLLTAGTAVSERLEVWPNPARETVSIRAETGSGNELLGLSLSDATGKQIYHTGTGNPAAIFQEWSVGELPAGIYAIVLETRNGLFCRRVQVTH
ncbi:MAG: T9SS C-terminal target domain-containing protein [Bacteroidetes bacterium]|nr:MAG: T9SS C-terminal target domain-containing protein [Bacteroidota bacterium]